MQRMRSFWLLDPACFLISLANSFSFLSYVWQLMRASSSEMFLRISGLRVIARDSHRSIYADNKNGDIAEGAFNRSFFRNIPAFFAVLLYSYSILLFCTSVLFPQCEKSFRFRGTLFLITLRLSALPDLPRRSEPSQLFVRCIQRSYHLRHDRCTESSSLSQ